MSITLSCIYEHEFLIQVKYYKPKIFKGKWKDCFLAVCEDSTLRLFSNKKNNKLIASIQIENDVQNIYCGNATFKIAAKRPSFPTSLSSFEASMDRLVAISTDSKGKHALWLLFDTNDDFDQCLYHITDISSEFETIPCKTNNMQIACIQNNYSTLSKSSLKKSKKKQRQEMEPWNSNFYYIPGFHPIYSTIINSPYSRAMIPKNDNFGYWYKVPSMEPLL